MPGNSPSAAPGSMRGFGAGPGAGSEQFDEQMLQAAMQQPAAQTPTATSANSGDNVGMPAPVEGTGQARAVTPEKELQWMMGDVKKGLVQLLDLNVLLTGKESGDTPEQQAKKRQMHQRYQSLEAKEKAIVDQKYHQQQVARQQAAEQEQANARQREQAHRQQMVMPASVKKGAVGPGGKSGKSQAAQQLEQQRKQMPGPSKVN